MKDEDRLLLEKYGGIRTSEYDSDCRRLKNGEPLAYVIGWTPFLDCRIYLDSHPLIPRPETEFWVEKALSEMRKKNQIRALDLFAGSGAIGVAVLKNIPSANVDFGEINRFHIQTIHKNVHENFIQSDRTMVFLTDVWSGINKKYDVILTNPPYIAKERAGRIEESVLNFEPHDALFAEHEGFALIERTILGARDHLTENGLLYIEHEPEQSQRVLSVGQSAKFDVWNMKDQYGVLRYSVLSRMS